MTIANPPQMMFEGALTFASVANSTSAWPEQTVTLPTGTKFPAGAGGHISLVLPSLQTGLAYCNVFAVSATTFKVRFFNATGGALTPTGTGAKLVMY